MDAIKLIFRLLAVPFLLVFSMNAQALTVVNTMLDGPDTDILCRNNDDPSLVQNCWTASTDPGANFEVKNPSNEALLGPDAFGSILGDLTELYKAESADPLGSDPAKVLGDLKGSYKTVFDFSRDDDYFGATISYLGGPSVDCSKECYLVVKDGNHNPVGYLFDLALGWDPMSKLGDGNGWPVDNGIPSWNGTMDLVLQNFWDGGGSISYLALYGYKQVNAVPVPAAFWLFGTALLGFIGLSRSTRV